MTIKKEKDTSKDKEVKDNRCVDKVCISKVSVEEVADSKLINVVLKNESNDVIDINLSEGKIYNKTKNKEYSFAPYPVEIQNLINIGGLVEYTKTKVR